MIVSVLTAVGWLAFLFVALTVVTAVSSVLLHARRGRQEEQNGR